MYFFLPFLKTGAPQIYLKFAKSENLSLTVLNDIRKFIPNSIDTMREEENLQIEQSEMTKITKTNDGNPPMLIILMRFPRVEWVNLIFPNISQVFLSLCEPNFVKNLEFKNNLRIRLKK